MASWDIPTQLLNLVFLAPRPTSTKITLPYSIGMRSIMTPHLLRHGRVRLCVCACRRACGCTGVRADKRTGVRTGMRACVRAYIQAKGCACERTGLRRCTYRRAGVRAEACVRAYGGTCIRPLACFSKYGFISRTLVTSGVSSVRPLMTMVTTHAHIMDQNLYVRPRGREARAYGRMYGHERRRTGGVRTCVRIYAARCSTDARACVRMKRTRGGVDGCTGVTRKNA